MRIVYYAPLKPLDHPVPSGDRLMARAFKALLERLGHDVDIVSTLRSYERDGNLNRQRALQRSAIAERMRLLAGALRSTAPALWFTYHAYHKAPDWLGPTVSKALSIPYVIAEASIAGKQAGGPWDLGHHATIEAVNAAAAVLALTQVDASNLARFMHDTTRLHHFPPFLRTSTGEPAERDGARLQVAEALNVPTAAVWLVTVAMMRADIKRDSYRLLAQALNELATPDWRLLVIGDGEAGDEVRDLLYRFAGDKVRFLGERPNADVARLCAVGDVFAWPALAEAYGMAILEALAAGLPVVACNEGGVADLVRHNENGLLAQARDAGELAAHLQTLIVDRTLRQRLAAAARARVAERHSLEVAENRLQSILTSVLDRPKTLKPCS